MPRRHVARVALRNDETLVLLICRADLIPGEPFRERQKAALRRAFGDMRWEVPEILDGMDGIEDLYFDRVSQIHLPCWTSGRAALIGDAAACPSFLAGEGTGLAMTEAYVLAGELHRSAGDLRRAFAAYDARLRSFVPPSRRPPCDCAASLYRRTRSHFECATWPCTPSPFRCSRIGYGRLLFVTISNCRNISRCECGRHCAFPRLHGRVSCSWIGRRASPARRRRWSTTRQSPRQTRATARCQEHPAQGG